MYNFLRPLLKSVGYVPLDKPKSLKTRVVFYHERKYEAPYYVAQYRRFGFWFNFKNFIQASNTPHLWFTDHPVISQNFNSLVNFCSKFKTYEDVIAYNKEELTKYREALAAYFAKNPKQKIRNWHSE